MGIITESTPANGPPILTVDPGFDMTTSHRVGSVRVQTAGTVQSQEDGLAFTLTQGATIQNAVNSTVALVWQWAQPDGTRTGQMHQRRLATGASVVIPDPPSGAVWVVADVSRGQVRVWGLEILGGAVGIGALAGYGLVSLVRNARTRKRRRR